MDTLAKIMTWDTALTTNLYNFIKDKSVVQCELKHKKSVENHIVGAESALYDCKAYHNIWDTYHSLTQNNTRFTNYHKSLSAKIYLIHKNLIYQESIINTLKGDYDSFIILDFTNINTQEADKYILDYSMSLTSTFDNMFIDEEQGRYAKKSVNKIITQRHKAMEDTIRKCLYSDYLLFIPLMYSKKKYTTPMFHRCNADMYKSVDILNTAASTEYSFLYYLGLRIPLIINKDVIITYACLKGVTHIDINNDTQNNALAIYRILMMLLLMSNPTKKTDYTKTDLSSKITENIKDKKVVDLLTYMFNNNTWEKDKED